MKKNKKLSQSELILDYMKTHRKGITPLEALEKFGCFRLSARIFEIKEAGYDVVTNIEEKVTKDGDVKRYGRYSLRTQL